MGNKLQMSLLVGVIPLRQFRVPTEPCQVYNRVHTDWFYHTPKNGGECRKWGTMPGPSELLILPTIEGIYRKRCFNIHDQPTARWLLISSKTHTILTTLSSHCEDLKKVQKLEYCCLQVQEQLINHQALELHCTTRTATLYHAICIGCTLYISLHYYGLVT